MNQPSDEPRRGRPPSDKKSQVLEAALTLKGLGVPLVVALTALGLPNAYTGWRQIPILPSLQFEKLDLLAQAALLLYERDPRLARRALSAPMDPDEPSVATLLASVRTEAELSAARVRIRAYVRQLTDPRTRLIIS